MQTLTDPSVVPPEEVARRIEEYRRLGYERRATPMVVYHPPSALCPWPGCGYRIDGIHFKLEDWCDSAALDRYLKAWWRGAGLVGRCPGCGKLVLFALTNKSKVTDQSGLTEALLPDDWIDKAHLVSKPPPETNGTQPV